MNDVQTPATATDPVEQLAALLAMLDATTQQPALAQLVGHGLLRELRHPIAAFRQRFPAYWPNGQQSLL